MKLRRILLSLMVACAFASPALAASGTIAVVNIQQVMQDSSAAKSMREQLDAKRKSFQSQVSKKEEELKKENQDLVKEQTVLSPEAFDKKLKEFKAKTIAAQKDAHAKGLSLEEALSASFGEIQKSVYSIVSSIAKDKGYSAVLVSSQLLYSDASLDITQDVLSKLNKTLPNVTVNFKSANAKEEE